MDLEEKQKWYWSSVPVEWASGSGTHATICNCTHSPDKQHAWETFWLYCGPYLSNLKLENYVVNDARNQPIVGKFTTFSSVI